jgi:hypothetical protein
MSSWVIMIFLGIKNTSYLDWQEASLCVSLFPCQSRRTSLKVAYSVLVNYIL